VSCAAALALRPGLTTVQSRPPPSLLDGPDMAGVTLCFFIFGFFLARERPVASTIEPSLLGSQFREYGQHRERPAAQRNRLMVEWLTL
jgi:hypothetical protein